MNSNNSSEFKLHDIIEQIVHIDNGQQQQQTVQIRKYEVVELLLAVNLIKLKDIDSLKCYNASIVSKATFQKQSSLARHLASIQIQKILNNQNILKLEIVFEDHTYFYMLYEELTPIVTLKQVLQRNITLSEREAVKITVKIVQALQYLHAKRIIHGNLKLSNVFIGGNNMELIKLGDLTFVIQLKDNEHSTRIIQGTNSFIAPEILKDDPIGYSYEVDIWYLGILVFTMLFGKSGDIKAIYKKIKANDYVFPDQPVVSNAAKELIGRLLQSEPAQRITLDQILIHPFVQQFN